MVCLFEVNFNTDNEENIHKEVARDEKIINYNNLIF